MKRILSLHLKYLLLALSVFFSQAISIAQTADKDSTFTSFTSQRISLLSTQAEDVVFGIDSNYIYLQRDGEHLRAFRNSNASLPGETETVAIMAVYDEAWEGIGRIQHVSIDSDRGLAVISARPYPGANDYDLFISSSVEPSRLQSKSSGSESAPRKWSRLFPLSSLNTDDNEVFPQFVEGGLYYASNGSFGASQSSPTKDFDIFFASRDLQWQSAVPLSSPFNSSLDDLSVVVLNEDEMYVSSNRQGNLDVFLISRPKLEPLASGFKLTITYDNLPVDGILVRWVDLSGIHYGAPVFESSTDMNGEIFLDGLPSSKTLSLRVGTSTAPPKKGSVIRIYNPDGDLVREYSINRAGIFTADFLPLDEIRGLQFLHGDDLSALPSRSPALISLHFDIDSIIPNKESRELLASWWTSNSRSILNTLISTPLVIEGHADMTGASLKNDVLSELRAVWFKEWLVAKGVSSAMLSTRGMGARFPMILCPVNSPENSTDCPPEVHAANRRVELRWKVGLKRWKVRMH